MRGEGEERLHVEGDGDDGDEADECEDRCALADFAIVAKASNANEVIVRMAVAFLLVHDEDAVERDGRDDGKEHEEDDGYGHHARCGHVAFGHGANIVGVADEAHAAVELFAVQGELRHGAVLELRHIDARVECVSTDEVGVGMEFDEVGLRREREHVAVLPYGDVAEHAFRGARLGIEEAQLLGVLLDDDHRVGVEARCVVPAQPVLAGKLDFDGARRLARGKAFAQIVEARIREVRLRFGCLCHDGAVRLDDEHVIDVQELAVLGHLGIRCLEPGVVCCHEGDAHRLRLIDGIEGLLVLRGLLFCAGEELLELACLFLHLGVVA